jgi:competence protein ComEC
MTNRNRRLLAWLILTLVICVCAAGCARQSAADKTRLCVTIADVRDGDCILITLPTGETMVIDTGRPEYRGAVEAAMAAAGITRVDILLLTHPHSDHIGNAQWMLENYPVGEVHQIDRYHDTKTYRDLAAYLAYSSVGVTLVKAGDAFTLGEARCRYLSPISVDTPNLNNACAVLRMEYGEVVFLFMGDAEWSAESLLMLNVPDALDADVLKVGHHALNSTSTAFLKAVTPDIAVVSMAPTEKSSNPEAHSDTLLNIARYANALYRTDVHGNILLLCDGEGVVVRTATDAAAQ